MESAAWSLPPTVGALDNVWWPRLCPGRPSLPPCRAYLQALVLLALEQPHRGAEFTQLPLAGSTRPPRSELNCGMCPCQENMQRAGRCLGFSLHNPAGDTCQDGTSLPRITSRPQPAWGRRNLLQPDTWLLCHPRSRSFSAVRPQGSGSAMHPGQ